MENNKKAIAITLKKKKKVASFFLKPGKVWEKEKRVATVQARRGTWHCVLGSHEK